MECNRRLYHYYRKLAPQLPNTFREMEPLFSAVMCGCNAGLLREALHEVYIPRVQRENVSFAANVLGATGPLLSVLSKYFENERWGSLVETAIEGQSLTAEDQLFILMQAGLYLTTTRGVGAPEARICYERAEPLCHSLNDARLLYVALMGQWRYILMTDKLSAALQIAERVYALTQQQNDATLTIGAYRALSCTLWCLGDFESGQQYAMRAVEIWRSGGVQTYAEEHYFSIVNCMMYAAFCAWHLGGITSSHAMINEAISLAKQLNDKNSLALALQLTATIAIVEGDPAKVGPLASELIELSTRHHFAHYMGVGAVLRGWACTASRETVEGIEWIEQGIKEVRSSGTVNGLPFFLELKAEALYLAKRVAEALEAISEAESLAERYEQRQVLSRLHWLRAVFLAAIGADQAQIEASFSAAIRIAKEQKSISLEKRAEATYAEYRRQKASGSPGRGIRLPLW
jgi:tetratricopeptide (TPR) repeat protein